jgi:hypothetical protein
MTKQNQQPMPDVYDFILANIDSVPHLEALVLLWNSRPAGWSCEDLAGRLYIATDKVKVLLRDLLRLQLVAESPEAPQTFSYFARSSEQDEMMLRVDAAYRHELVRISTMIHSKTSSSVLEFARAFRLKKERDR